MDPVHTVQRVHLIRHPLEGPGVIGYAVQVQFLNQQVVGLLLVVDQRGTLDDVILEGVVHTQLGGFPLTQVNRIRRLLGADHPDTHLVPGDSMESLPDIVVLEILLPKRDVSFIHPHFLVQKYVILIDFEHNEQFFEPVAGGSECILVVPAVGIDAQVPLDIQRVLDPLADRDLMILEDGSSNRSEGLLALQTVVALNLILVKTPLADVKAAAVGAALGWVGVDEVSFARTSKVRVLFLVGVQVVPFDELLGWSQLICFLPGNLSPRTPARFAYTAHLLCFATYCTTLTNSLQVRIFILFVELKIL